MPPSERDTNTGTSGSSNSKLGSSSSPAVSSTTTTASSSSSSDTKRCTARNSSSGSGTTITTPPASTYSSTSTPTPTSSTPTSSTSQKTGTRPGPRPSSSLVTRYRTTLNAISARTGTALPSLMTSFVVLHEVTAVVPLVGVFFACRSFGVGERLVSSTSSMNGGLLDGFKKKQELEGVGSGAGSGLSDNGAVKFDKGETVVGVVGVNGVGGGGGGGGVGRDADNTDVVDNDNDVDKGKGKGMDLGKGKGWVDGVRDRWLAEGEAWVGHVGRYYGILGFEKSRRTPVDSGLGSALGMSEEERAAVAADVANAVVAYCATKALLPVRIGFSLYLAPSFSRRLLDPAARRLVRLTKIFRVPPTHLTYNYLLQQLHQLQLQLQQLYLVLPLRALLLLTARRYLIDQTTKSKPRAVQGGHARPRLDSIF
ncbi:protein related to Beta3 (Ruby) [Pyrrhoderma noxium]|uniref:Protein related to Beta3 (Ruby) n=1 Tax=Pyrrhoderma noxium TaxID=2282107 RepID=A0A286U8P4_9AGAM|nr:protein related to Beta3 (Ruby) [Pyrrhoderma noxium]